MRLKQKDGSLLALRSGVITVEAPPIIGRACFDEIWRALKARNSSPMPPRAEVPRVLGGSGEDAGDDVSDRRGAQHRKGPTVPRAFPGDIGTNTVTLEVTKAAVKYLKECRRETDEPRVVMDNPPLLRWSAGDRITKPLMDSCTIAISGSARNQTFSSNMANLPNANCNGGRYFDKSTRRPHWNRPIRKPREALKCRSFPETTELDNFGSRCKSRS